MEWGKGTCPFQLRAHGRIEETVREQLRATMNKPVTDGIRRRPAAFNELQNDARSIQQRGRGV